MELKSNHSSPVLADPAPINKTRLGIHSPVSSSKCIPMLRRKQGKLDEALSNGWLDAMRASSPPRKKLIKGYCVDIALDDAEIAYCSWKIKHPSALNSFDQITKQAKKKKIAIFLDYDGTLSPIVDNPDDALMSSEMRLAVKNVAEFFPTTIISGRSRYKVHELVGLTELYYAGSHGMDIMGPVGITTSVDHHGCIKLIDRQGEESKQFQPAGEFLPMIDEVFRTLIEKTKGIKGTMVENNKFCASVHYRNVDEKKWCTIARLVHNLLKDYPRLQITHGRKVLEIRPAVDWNKGKAVEFLLDSLGFTNQADVLPIYIGDDRTDEDAFMMLGKKKCGVGILVSSTPKETEAVYSLRDPSEVMEFLKSLVAWKKMEDA
ncbi:hypothetical protein BT93_E0114 [Corymbia citriodora subsp. variegata]|nr:hypothetical protein BT93_E0114 [Corymbia citriodora subsp. variegata]